MAARYGPVEAAGTSAGATAADLLAAVRVHADRVHDAVRRLGCDRRAAAEVVETSALDLVDTVGTRPETVPDAVGWWFARARALALQLATNAPDLPLGGGVLAVDEDQEVLAASLERLPEPERFVLLLRDAYDLPAESVAAAIGTGTEAALARVGRARLAFLALVDDGPVLDIPAHQSDVEALARIGEGGPVAARDATTRRHALSCEDCRALTDAQQRAHALLTGLAVVALPEAERVGVLARVQSAAYAALPARAEHLLSSCDEVRDDDEPRSSRLLLVLLLPVVAAALGVGLGVLLSQTGADEQAGALPEDAQLITPPPPAPSTTVSPPTLQFPAPRTTVFILPPPSPPPAPAPEPTVAPPAEPLAITLDQTSGPDGEPLTVSGTGWTPGIEVRLEYVEPTGRPTQSQAVATADADGRFTAELVALDPERLPGPHVVRASDGELTAEASYDAQP
ncbi:hypothetical protein BH24ACT10_BH24ACT10_05560 [soil metagenome]